MEDRKERCSWCLGFPEYIEYHDKEWGVPVYEDKVLFEFLILEGAQAGLSWATILKKREGYRAVFADFDVQKVASFSDEHIASLCSDARIVRNRLKIKSVVTNARCFIEVQKEFGSFSNYIWKFVDGQPIQNAFEQLSEVPASTPISDAMSKDLKKRGFKFVGSTIMYAFMQACGLVNDHLVSCFRYHEVKK